MPKAGSPVCRAIGTFQRVRPTGRKLGNWRYAFEEDIGTLASFAFSLLPEDHGVNKTPLPVSPAIIHHDTTVPTCQGQATMD